MSGPRSSVAIATSSWMSSRTPIRPRPSCSPWSPAMLSMSRWWATTIRPSMGVFVQKGKKYNAQDQSAARVSARWKPSDNFLWDLSYEDFQDRGTPNMNLMQHPRPGQDFWSALVDVAPYLDRSEERRVGKE